MPHIQRRGLVAFQIVQQCLRLFKHGVELPACRFHEVLLDGGFQHFLHGIVVVVQVQNGDGLVVAAQLPQGQNLKEFLNMYMPLALRSQWNVETAKQSLINVGFTILEAYEDYGYLHFRSLSQLDTYLKKVVPELTKEREKFVTFYTQALRDIKNQGFYSLSTYRFIIIAKLTGSYQEIAQEHQL